MRGADSSLNQVSGSRSAEVTSSSAPEHLHQSARQSESAGPRPGVAPLQPARPRAPSRARSMNEGTGDADPVSPVSPGALPSGTPLGRPRQLACPACRCTPTYQRNASHQDVRLAKACTMCAVAFAHRAHHTHCARCLAAFCSRCLTIRAKRTPRPRIFDRNILDRTVRAHRDDPHPRATETRPNHAPGEENAPQHSPRDATPGDHARVHLLERLRQIPPVGGPTILWAPRPVRQQCAHALATCLEQANAHAQAQDGLEAEIAFLTLRNISQLLFRADPRSRDIAQQELPDGPGGTASTLTACLRSRLRDIRNGNWLSLVDALLADLAAAEEAHRIARSPRAHTTGSDITADQAQAAGVRARTGALKSAASILTGGPPVPPSPDIAAAISAQFITTASPEQEQDLRDALAAASSIHTRAKFRPKLKHIATQIGKIKAAAGPGPSALRNSHLQVLYSAPNGPAALLAWTDNWATGTVSPWAASFWTAAVARPFWKTPHPGGYQTYPLRRKPAEVCDGSHCRRLSGSDRGGRWAEPVRRRTPKWSRGRNRSSASCRQSVS